MRISIISMSSYATPPWSYGGEIFISDLAEALGSLGHEITLYAAPGSICTPHVKELHYLPSLYGEALTRTAEGAVVRWFTKEILASDYIIDASHEKEMMQEIAYFHPEAKGRTVGILNGLVTHTPWCPRFGLIVGSQKWKELSIKGLSQFADTVWEQEYGRFIPKLPEKAVAAVIPWATNTEFYCPSDYEKEDYYLFLSRPTPYKGLGDAIRLAQELGFKLRVVMPQEIAEHKYFGEQYMKLIEEAVNKGAKIEIAKLPSNSFHHIAKRQLFRKAKALIAPFSSHEPFGLVLIEAMACGTPVIGRRIGSLPEIINHGRNGFLYFDDEGFKNALNWLAQIDPHECRRDAVERFDRGLAAQRYVELHERLKGAK